MISTVGNGNGTVTENKNINCIFSQKLAIAKSAIKKRILGKKMHLLKYLQYF